MNTELFESLVIKFMVAAAAGLAAWFGVSTINHDSRITRIEAVAEGAAVERNLNRTLNERNVLALEGIHKDLGTIRTDVGIIKERTGFLERRADKLEENVPRD